MARRATCTRSQYLTGIIANCQQCQCQLIVYFWFRFVRIAPNGRVSYSQRLTLWAKCPMNLQKFPLDSQVCPLVVGSFGYSAKDVVYEWAKPKAVSIDKLGLAQFHLKEFKTYNQILEMNRRTRSGFRNDSVANIDFLFERQTGFFLLQVMSLTLMRMDPMIVLIDIADLYPAYPDCLLLLGGVLADQNGKGGRSSCQNSSWCDLCPQRCQHWFWWQIQASSWVIKCNLIS